MTPAHAAKRLLIGTGFGLLLATGLALISGMMKFSQPDLGIAIPVLGIICLVLADFTGKGKGPLSRWFPLEDKVAMAARIENKVVEIEKDSHLGDAWARLEETMLSKELEEE
jgi:hypothetical protein